MVTSLAEVWIEICIITITYSKYKSLPLRKCGLKFVLPVRVSKLLVTSLAEVWIEIPHREHLHRLIFRHFPCGSVDWNFPKLPAYPSCPRHFPCGSVDWNMNPSPAGTTLTVTSLAEVWIEIGKREESLPSAFRHFPCGSVDWNSKRLTTLGNDHRHFPCGSVDWNLHGSPPFRSIGESLPLRKCGLKLCIQWSNGQALCHFPCGSVDWNYAGRIIISNPLSHFPCGSVDWNLRGGWSGLIVVGHFPCGSVDWNRSDQLVYRHCPGHFPCGSVDWNSEK